ncbi:hypothetical protein L873DRAFT_1793115 [Choiromyces venosus 120613-1]|uniref:Uncharacterized protein n=1 Tax=Choiromyces venosus 120613-1 TaxID=1336337 RepID=A0A3N4J7E7_9PEZI|nr:hypothetical protein L873DRAFT_1793115 [Choiromyces venosus 120613-1]
MRFQQWAKGIQISLVQAELQQQSYKNVQKRIQEEAKHKSKSRSIIQKGGVITIEAARCRPQEKAEKEKAAAIKKPERSILIAVTKVKASLNRHGINTCKAERERKKQVKAIKVRVEIVPAEMLVAICDPERDPSPENLESLQVHPDILQALLLLESLSSSISYSEAADVQIYTTTGEAERRYTIDHTGGGNSFTVDDGEDLVGESDSDSSSISSDSIMRNANFVSFN